MRKAENWLSEKELESGTKGSTGVPRDRRRTQGWREDLKKAIEKMGSHTGRFSGHWDKQP